MNEQVPSIGRIVHYRLTPQDVEQIMRRRTTGASIAERIKQQVMTPDQDAEKMPKVVPSWPAGAQAHIGNDVQAGDILPAMVLRVWGESGCSNLKVQLDGSDEFWATSISFDETKAPGTWHWMFDGQQKRYTPDSAKA